MDAAIRALQRFCDMPGFFWPDDQEQVMLSCFQHPAGVIQQDGIAMKIQRKFQRGRGYYLAERLGCGVDDLLVVAASGSKINSWMGRGV